MVRISEKEEQSTIDRLNFASAILKDLPALERCFRPLSPSTNISMEMEDFLLAAYQALQECFQARGR